ncbi:hypothetical protein BJF85_07935 [Saccharomonospora sp. CUA-673]|uniref:SMI1/KNR4 family protein n=1 Tax=Saccharomonospora sp. CUA-673 TaxID=1904969 RepID=UPI00096347C8|nr:SMI1/KNR4 family protein [Saccharomonospora sp. CUA-673]OLT39116.1 hypothetical protein BJF85_07935 [Saccharomonospora sp. CUA-673]
MSSDLDVLLERAVGPSGQPLQVSFDADDGPLEQLGTLLSRQNGFFAFNAGVQVFRAGEPGIGPEIQAWNEPATWKDTYAGLADDLFCFGQDLFGTQFAIERRARIVTFDPETAQRQPIGITLEDWAGWLLDDRDVRGCRAFATAWQDDHGPLGYDERLVPRRFFTLGGSYTFDNLVVRDGATAMRIRGPIAQRLHDLPAGRTVTMTAHQPPGRDT